MVLIYQPVLSFRLPTRGFDLVTREFELVTRESKFVTRGFELETREFELVTRVLLSTYVMGTVLYFSYEFVIRISVLWRFPNVYSRPFHYSTLFFKICKPVKIERVKLMECVFYDFITYFYVVYT